MNENTSWYLLRILTSISMRCGVKWMRQSDIKIRHSEKFSKTLWCILEKDAAVKLDETLNQPKYIKRNKRIQRNLRVFFCFCLLLVIYWQFEWDARLTIEHVSKHEHTLISRIIKEKISGGRGWGWPLFIEQMISHVRLSSYAELKPAIWQQGRVESICCSTIKPTSELTTKRNKNCC